MKQRFLGLVVAWSILSFVTPSPVFAQASRGSLSGVVTDVGGGVLPGATVVVKNITSDASFEVTTNTEGLFSVPSLDAGSYTVHVSLTGFKTALINDVRISPGTPVNIKAVLEVGQLEETVTVSSSSELINTQTATVSSTLNVDQINQMPTPSRNALNAVTFLPGVNTPGINRNSTVNGLPESFMNITLDGVSNADNFNKSTDGFFANVTPRQDAIEAVTVTTAAGGAQTGGSGAVSINFVTRSGTNRFSGSGYEYFRHWELNSNYWFNKRDGLPRNEIKLNQYGARVGGPIVLPGLFDGRDKAFFFFNYEQLRFPNSFTRNRTVLHPRALEGWFRYSVAGQVREVNVLELAARNGQLASVDPIVQRLLSQIVAASATSGAVTAQSDPLLMNYRWQSPGKLFEQQPSFRIDYNLSDKHRLTFSSSLIDTYRDPDYLNSTDVRFPGAPNFRRFDRMSPLFSGALRSTLTSNVVNELRGGTTRGGSSHFGSETHPSVDMFADQGGYAIDFDANIGLTNWHASNGPSWRSAYTYSLEDTLNWQKGRHSLTLGGAMLLTRAWESEKQVVPGINLRFDTTNDPARDLFGTANFPNASGAQLSDARDLYALLTGRVGGVTGLAALDDSGTYQAFAPIRRQGKMDMHSLFVQDSWRLTPALTLNAGLRWDVQLPFTPTSDVLTAATMADVCGISGLGDGGTYSKCRFNEPGLGASPTIPQYVNLTSGTKGYDTDWNNVAPNVSLAWRPNVESGWLRKVLGDPEQATLRAGYSVAYERQGMAAFIGRYDDNPGGTLSLTRDASTGLVGPGETWPVLLRDPSRLYNAPFPNTPTYPIVSRPNRADDLGAFAPDIQIASARTWTVSFQRALTKDMAVDIRYVGTRGVNQWSTLNYNDDSVNLETNRFIDEFRLAMGNLQANNAAGGNRSGSFAYFGPGSGTNPLPIYLAYLNGLPAARAGDPSAYTGGNQTWTNTTLTQRLVRTNPRPATSAVDLDGDLTFRDNALRAGLPANFFVVNPNIDDVSVTDSGAYSDYHALQLELKRRLSKGLAANVSYQYAVEGGSSFLGFRYGRVMNPSANVRHAIKTQWDWEIPVGRGHRFGTNLGPFLNGILGGWQFNGVGRIQARTINFGNVRLVGMSLDELTSVYKHEIRANPDTGLATVYNLPQDIIDNTLRAFNVSTTSPTGYSSRGVPEGRYFAPANSADCLQLKAGDCAPRTVLVRAPWFTRFDIGVTKRFPIQGAMNFELRVDVLNVFDNINFNPFDFTDISATLNTAYTNASFGQVTTAYQDPSNTFDPGGRLGQVMFRLNW
jgi:carboxypeptidase family protein/TonB-dependent receptor-like protein